MIRIAEGRARPGSGSSPAVLRERSSHYGTPVLGRVPRQFRFVVVGGLATRLYMQERMTLDADILVLAGDLPVAETALAGAGFVRRGALTVGGSTWTAPDGSPLDLIAPDQPWVAEALELSVAGPDGLQYISLPYLVLMKLQSGRMQDLADIGRMLGGADDEQLAGTREVVMRYAPADSEDLDSMIRLGKLEHRPAPGERPQQTPS